MKKLILACVCLLGISVAMADDAKKPTDKNPKTQTPKTSLEKKPTSGVKTSDVTAQTPAKPSTNGQQAASAPKATPVGSANSTSNKAEDANATKTSTQDASKQTDKTPVSEDANKTPSPKQTKTAPAPNNATATQTVEAKAGNSATPTTLIIQQTPEEKPDAGWHGSMGANILHATNLGDVKVNGFTEIDLVKKENRLQGLGSEVYLTFEHPIPVLPNFKFQYTGLRVSKDGNISIFQSFKDNVNSGLYADNSGTIDPKSGFLDFSHIDVTLYYRLVPQDIAFQFDLGLSARYFIYPLNKLLPIKEGTTINQKTADGSESRSYQILPMIYVDMTGIIPDTGVSFTLAGNFMVLSKNDYINDWKLGIKYTMEFVPYVQPGLELGYRYIGLHSMAQNKKTKHKIEVDFHNNAVYAGIFLSF